METQEIQGGKEDRIILRSEAKASGLTRYFTGKLCKRGHIAPRLTCSGTCIICAYETWKRTVGQSPKRKAWEAARIRDPLIMWPIKAAWKKRNLHKVAADSSKRRASQFKACPWWADMVAIEAVYRECRKLTQLSGIDHHVDHIVPILGKNVCGLHVHWNLRVISAKENQVKGNDLIPEVCVAIGHVPMPPRQADLFWSAP